MKYKYKRANTETLRQTERHCVESARIRSFSDLYFPCIRTKYGDFIRGHKGQNFTETRCRGFLDLET